MINYETILSLFDDKLTLLQYLTKIEEALKNEQLTDITVTQTDASHVYFTFVFEDGTTIDTPTFSLPQGEQGEQGIQGVSVVDADIDASGHLILTLSNGNTIDAGATGLQTVTASDVDSETATQYEVLKADGNGGASWGKVLASNIDPQTATSEKFLQAGLYGGAVWSKISRGSIDTTGETSGKVLTTDGSGGASWENIPAQTPEGTVIKSTGETSGKVLTADGSGGASWETPSGGEQLYMHSIKILGGINQTGHIEALCFNFTIIDKRDTAYTQSSILSYLNNKGKPIWGFGYQYRLDTSPAEYHYVYAITTSSNGLQFRFTYATTMPTTYTTGSTYTPNVGTLSVYDTVIAI